MPRKSGHSQLDTANCEDPLPHLRARGFLFAVYSVAMHDINAEILNWINFAKGDLPGHPFRGNQWTTGEGSLSAKTADLAQRQGEMTRSERVAMHRDIANHHDDLAAQHRAEAEKLKHPVETPELDKALANLRAVREGRVVAGSGNNTITSVKDLKTALRGVGGDSIGELTVSLEALASAPKGSPLEANALSAASAARDDAVSALVSTAQHIENTFEGVGTPLDWQQVGEIAPQDQEAMRNLASSLLDQAKDIMTSTSGMGLALPHSIEYADPDFSFANNLSGEQLTLADGRPASSLIDEGDLNSARKVYDYAQGYFTDNNGKEFNTEFYNKLSTDSQKMLEREATNYIENRLGLTSRLERGDLPVPAGTTVPTLTAPPVAANHGGYVGVQGSMEWSPRFGGSNAEEQSLWNGLANLNAGKLQPVTVDTLRKLADRVGKR